MIKLTFDFPPVAQARPRATRFGKGIRLYDPKQVHVCKVSLDSIFELIIGLLIVTFVVANLIDL